MTAPPGPREGIGEPAEPTSEILLWLIDAAPEPRIQLGEIVRGLGDRTFGFLIFIFAMPNGVPGPSIPGLSTITGVPLIVVALQMALGRPRPWLPGWLARCSLPRAGLRAVLVKALSCWLRTASAAAAAASVVAVEGALGLAITVVPPATALAWVPLTAPPVVEI